MRNEYVWGIFGHKWLGWLTVLLAVTISPRNGAAHSALQVFEHDEKVGQVSISSDGSVVAVACNTYAKAAGPIILWDAKTGRQIKKLQGHQFSTVGLAFVQKDQYLLSAGLAERIRVVKAKTGEVVSKTEKMGKLVSASSFCDKIFILTNSDGDVLYWDFSSVELPMRAKDQPSFGGLLNSRLAISADNKLLVKATNQGLTEFWPNKPARIEIWDIAARRRFRQFDAQARNNITCLGVSPDKTMLALGYFFGHTNGEVRSVSDGKVLFHAPVFPSLLSTITFSPDSKYLVTGDGDGKLTIWDIKKKTVNSRVKNAHRAAIQFLQFSPDGKHLVSGGEYTVKIWKWSDLMK